VRRQNLVDIHGREAVEQLSQPSTEGVNAMFGMLRGPNMPVVNTMRACGKNTKVSPACWPGPR
jgi:hypothetical protein